MKPIKSSRLIEANYSRFIKNILLKTKNSLLLKLKQIYKISNKEKQLLKNDSIQELLDMIDALKNNVKIDKKELKKIYNNINKYNQEIEEELLQEHLPLITKTIKEREDLFIITNSKYIKDLNVKTLNEIENDIINIINSNQEQEEIIKAINNRFNNSKKSADNISTVSTLNENGSLSLLRTIDFTDIYNWYTMRDEKVRSSHNPLNGKYCKISDSTVYANTIEDVKNNKWLKRTNNMTMSAPGFDYHCRCWGIPVIF